MAGTRIDGRSVLREQRRDAILASTRDLAMTSGPDGFTVDEVAAAAGVSRRTVFNHFPTFESLLVAVCEQVLAQVTDQLLHTIDAKLANLPVDTGRHVAAIDGLCEAVRDTDLPTAMTTIVGIVGEDHEDQPRGQAISQAALDHVGRRLVAQVQTHVPDIDAVALSLTVAFLMNGIGVLARRWVHEYAAKLTPASRRAWRAYMTRLIEQLAGGYRSAIQRGPR
jgi:AcrR family transcriptional regulator